MICTMEPLMKILPPSFRPCLMGEDLRELRLRLGQKPERITASGPSFSGPCVTCEDLAHIINGASRYSPWQAETMAMGYLTTKGGHRIGICGEAIVHKDSVKGIRNPDALCIRLARDLENIGHRFRSLRHSTLILGPPCSGKTTLLRDIARVLAEEKTVAVVDERDELFPEGFRRGKRMDVLRLCPKAEGIDMVLRTMGPEWICVDEITREEDTQAVLRASNCGIHLLASAHAFDLADLQKRFIYRKILEAGVFDNIVVIQKDNRYMWERKEPWV